MLLALADVASDDGDVTAYARGQKVLAAKANVDHRTVRRAIDDLEEIGEVQVLKLGDGRERSDYRIVLPGLGDADVLPGRAGRPPSPDEMSSQGGQVAPPISPSLSVEVHPLTLVDVPSTSPATVVFDAWREATGKTRAVLDDKRRRKIDQALKHYPLDEVLDAVRGWQHDPFYGGANDRATAYNEIDLLLRDGAHIEKFRDLARSGCSSPQMSRSAHAIAAWANQ